jgi:TPP-dependent pyruvate/acetoin dehydrogenase alpha subunit
MTRQRTARREGTPLRNQESHTAEFLLRVYHTMRTIRTFEDRLHKEFATGDIPGFVHLYAGQEASAAGVCAHLDRRDRVASTHRGHGHCVAMGMDVGAMMAEIFGRAAGACRGKGGSMHIADPDRGVLGSNGIVGAGVPLACGAALAATLRGTGGVAVAFFGDGASNQGTVLESLNLAAVWRLPVLFVCENNGYAQSTSSGYAVAASSIAERSAGFGLPAVTVDGYDFWAVHEAAGEAVGRARQGGGPSLIEIGSTRIYGHHEGDQQTYRTRRPEGAPDCLTYFRHRTTASGQLSTGQLDAVDAEVRSRIDAAVDSARQATRPTPGDLAIDVYTSH